jgi:hypothetical protein
MFPTSLSRDPALSLPSPSVQNQIHELAKTLPLPRKQNIACDACRCAANSYYPLITLIPHYLPSLSRAPNRQRKVKCHQLPGQPKVRLPHLNSSSPLRSFVPGAFFQCQVCLSFSPFSHHAPLTYTCPRPALYGEKLSLHVRTFPPFLSPRRQVNVRPSLFRHHAQQATSEKKRIATVNRRPRAYTSNPQQRSVFSLSHVLHPRRVLLLTRLSISLTPLSPHLCSAHPLLTSRSFPYISPPPLSDRIQGPTSPPPFPPVPKPLHFTILIPLSVRQSDVIPILQTSSHIFYPLSRKYSKPLA